MTDSPESLFEKLLENLREKYGDRVNDFLFPPPVFLEMQGEFLEIDLDNNNLLSTKFPVLEKYLNPYRAMQGGMIAAAIDNTLGPLSVAIAPPNVTRTLEVKYSQPVTMQMEYIVVQARLVERSDPKLVFEAKVTSPSGNKLATCKAVHWILENSLR